MKRMLFCVFLFVLASVGTVVAQEAAVVEINTFLPSGSVMQGTGFFFRDDASILTAYHVIEGAKGITVILQNEAGSYSDVMVEYISTKYDIAMIYLPSLKRSMGYLPLAAKQHIPRVDEPLKVIGYPRMGMQQRFRGYTTTTNFINSKTWLDRSGYQIFNESIDVLPIDLSNYVGMSGAPVISNQGVIGLFSGSYSEGGALGWLIPRKYFGSLAKIHKRPNEIQSWPNLTLMGSRFKDLRRSLNLNPHASSLIRSYLNEVEALSEVYDRLAKFSMQLKADAQILGLIIETIPPNQPTIEPLEPLRDRFSSDLEAFEKANQSYSSITNSLIRKMFDVANWFDHESGFNSKERYKLTRDLEQISSRYANIVKQDYYSAIGMTKQKMQEFVYAGRMMFEAKTDSDKLAAVRNLISVLNRQMGLYHSTHAVNYASQDVRRHRAYGKTFMEAAE